MRAWTVPVLFLALLGTVLAGCVTADNPAPSAPGALAADAAQHGMNSNGVIDVTVGLSENVPLGNTLDLPAGQKVNLTLVVGDASGLPAEEQRAYQGIRVQCPTAGLQTPTIATNAFGTYTFTMPAHPVACNIERASTHQTYDTLTLQPT